MTKSERDKLLKRYESAVCCERLAYGKKWNYPSDYADQEWYTASTVLRCVTAICGDFDVAEKYMAPAREAGTQRAFRYFDQLGWTDARDAVSN